MKNLLVGSIALVTLLFSLQSCNEEIELVENYEEAAIVYGLLDQADTVHMIKITRSFIGDGDASALTISQNPDSSYFESVSGTVSEILNGTVTRVFTLKDTIVDNKDEDGVFYAPTQRLYYFTTDANAPLNGDAEYRLDADINNGEFAISSTTPLVNNLTAQSIGSPTSQFRFISNLGEYTNTIINMSNTGDAHKLNMTLTVNFTEWVGTTPTERSFEWLLGETDVEPNSAKAFTATGATFYDLVRQHCTDDSAIDKRTFTGIDITVVGASEELERYIQINSPASSLAQNKPTFTNLTATKGRLVFGLFSSRQTVRINKPNIDPGGNSNIRCINKKSMEHLCSGGVSPFTFCSDHPADIATSESWACQ